MTSMTFFLKNNIYKLRMKDQCWRSGVDYYSSASGAPSEAKPKQSLVFMEVLTAGKVRTNWRWEQTDEAASASFLGSRSPGKSSHARSCPYLYHLCRGFSSTWLWLKSVIPGVNKSNSVSSVNIWLISPMECVKVLTLTHTSKSLHPLISTSLTVKRDKSLSADLQWVPPLPEIPSLESNPNQF